MVILAFQDDGTKVSSLIKWWTKSDFSHCEIIIDNYWISSGPRGGAYIQKLRPLTDKYIYVNVSVQQDKIHEALYFAFCQIGTKYDWLGIFFTQFIKMNAQNEDKWFCSEICTSLLQIMNNKQVQNLKSVDQSPGDLYKLFRKEQNDI